MISSFEEWCWELMFEEEKEDFVKSLIANMCWMIWKERCKFEYQHVQVNPILVGANAMPFTNHFLQLQLKKKHWKDLQIDVAVEAMNIGELQMQIF